MRPGTMVCIEQASRVQEAVKVPFQNPKAAMTTEQYRRLSQRQPPQEGRRDSAASGASEDGRSTAGALGRLFGLPLLAERHEGETSAVVVNTSPLSSRGDAPMQHSSPPTSNRADSQAPPWGFPEGGSVRQPPAKRRAQGGRTGAIVSQQVPQLHQGRRPEKKDAEMLTIDNILGGKVEKPKILPSWRNATLKDMSDKQKWSAAKCASEIQEIEELQAAINLIPEEIGSMADAVVLSSLDRLARSPCDRNRHPGEATL